jgi:DNA replication protein DnaC
VSGGASATAIEAPPAPTSVFQLPSDHRLNEIEQRVRRIENARRFHRRHPDTPAARLEPGDAEALDLWTTSGFRWYSAALRAEVPRRYWFFDLYSGLQTPAVKAARRFCEGSGSDDDEEPDVEWPSCLVLLGPAGVGKTVAGVGVLRVSDEDLRFFDVRALSRALMDPAKRDEALDLALTSATILLDDVGAAYVKADSFLEGLLEEIFIHREAHALDTIMTSNLTRRQLDEAVGERVADRLAGPWGSVHELPGKSLRRRG